MREVEAEMAAEEMVGILCHLCSMHETSSILPCCHFEEVLFASWPTASLAVHFSVPVAFPATEQYG